MRIVTAVADMELGLVGGVLVDDDFVAGARRATRGDERNGLSRALEFQPKPRRGRTRPRVADGLAVLVDDLCEVELHVALGRLDAGHATARFTTEPGIHGR